MEIKLDKLTFLIIVYNNYYKLLERKLEIKDSLDTFE